MTNDVKAAAAATPAKKSDASLAFWFTVSGWIGETAGGRVEKGSALRVEPHRLGMRVE